MTLSVIKDANGNVLNVGDIVVFNAPGLNGHDETGVVTRIERDCVWNAESGKYDAPWGDEFQYVLWVRWHCHGEETGECLDVREGSHEWLLKARQLTLTIGGSVA